MKNKLLVVCVVVWGTSIMAKTTDPNHDSCTKLQSKVIYTIEQDDVLSDILQTFELTPLWGKSNFVRKSLKINRLNNPDFILSGKELEIPFRCEEDAQRFSLINRGESRLIDSTKLIKVKTVKVSNEKKMVLEYPDGTRKPFDEEAPPVPEHSTPVTKTSLDETPKPKVSPPVEKIKKEFIKNLSIGLVSGFKKITSTDLVTNKNSTLLSEPIMGAQINLSFGEVKNLRTSFFYHYQSVKFILDDSTTIENAQSSLSLLGTSFEKNYHQIGTFKLRAQYGEYQFLTGSSSSGVTVRKFWRPSTALDYGFSFLKNNSFDLSILTSYQTSLPVEAQGQKLKLGHGPSIGSNLSTTLFSRPLDFGIMYSLFFQESKTYEQTDHLISLSGILQF